MLPGSAGPDERRAGATWRADGNKGLSEAAMSDPGDAAPRGVEAGYSVRGVQDRVRVRRAIAKSRTAKSLISSNLRFCMSFDHRRENWLKSVEFTPTFVSGRSWGGTSRSLAINSVHFRTFAPSHLHLPGTLRRSSHPSFALANP